MIRDWGITKLGTYNPKIPNPLVCKKQVTGCDKETRSDCFRPQFRSKSQRAASNISTSQKAEKDDDSTQWTLLSVFKDSNNGLQNHNKQFRLQLYHPFVAVCIKQKQRKCVFFFFYEWQISPLSLFSVYFQYIFYCALGGV